MKRRIVEKYLKKMEKYLFRDKVHRKSIISFEPTLLGLGYFALIKGRD